LQDECRAAGSASIRATGPWSPRTEVSTSVPRGARRIAPDSDASDVVERRLRRDEAGSALATPSDPLRASWRASSPPMLPPAPVMRTRLPGRKRSSSALPRVCRTLSRCRERLLVGRARVWADGNALRSGWRPSEGKSRGKSFTPAVKAAMRCTVTRSGGRDGWRPRTCSTPCFLMDHGQIGDHFRPGWGAPQRGSSSACPDRSSTTADQLHVASSRPSSGPWRGPRRPAPAPHDHEAPWPIGGAR
jgi:hypothetical protein